ncbi:uncharacterized protein LOC124268948 [Haliotis rubra]|uniref:uncharacterized protein LOC124268948 n=1 Tax=Haliotis rubra TaxID=36100 RepID=UPI001EE62D55|nr:uncharacterized protein LOC124268948 [Haliotis rubra]
MEFSGMCIAGLGVFVVMMQFPGTLVQTTCVFPEFLQSPSEDGSLKPWSTRMWWLNLRHLPRWVEKQDVFIDGPWLWRHRDILKNCDRVTRRAYRKTSFGQCSQRQLVYNRTCLAAKGFNKFQVVQYGPDRTPKFACMKFLRRSENVVQVLESAPRETNDAGLCDESNLKLDEWPWVGPYTSRPYFCPISGGFTFRTFSRLTNEDVCEDEWRRSQLEIECLSGDGLDFIAPTGSICNPFLRHGVWKRLTCCAGWENNGFIFIVASDVSEKPRYCLRFPKNQDGEFSVLIYFNVICPEEPDGKPPHGIEYYEMRMRRRDPNRCEDDDDRKCRELLATGVCGKDINISQHCKKTCQMCQGQPRQKCRFDPKLHGNWMLYDRDRNEEISINHNRASFSKFGRFSCRETGSDENQYKTVSEFTNGCSPRYTCIEFHRRNNNVLQYRISKSMRTDADLEDLCSFHDDPFPLGDSYRSFFYKNLVLSKKLWPSYCGLDSTIPFNGSFNGEHCEGTVSDWDEESCTTKGTMLLRSHTCGSLLAPMEFQCLAYIREEETTQQQLLITRSMDGRNEFNCWVITNYVSGGRWPWRAMYRMPTTQCSVLTDVEIDSNILKPKAALYLEDRSRSKVCKPAEISPVTVSVRLLTSAMPNIYDIDTQGNGRSANTNIPYESPREQPGAPNLGGMYSSAGNVRLPSLLMLLALMSVTTSSR